MVKGISRQVIVVHAPEPRLFEQAIFILKEDAIDQGITDELLLKEAERVVRNGGQHHSKRQRYTYGAAWASAGAAVTGLVWLVISLL